MKTEKIIFLLFLFSLIYIIFLSQNTEPIIAGKISKIYEKEYTSLTINNLTIIAYSPKKINLKVGDEVIIYGNSQNGEVIFADKIIKND